MLIEDGPGGKSRPLRTVDATDDGRRIWFAGDGKSVGSYDLETGERNDYSGVSADGGNPSIDELGGTVGALTVAGGRRSEKLLLADSSGNVLPAHVDDGREGDEFRTGSSPPTPPATPR